MWILRDDVLNLWAVNKLLKTPTGEYYVSPSSNDCIPLKPGIRKFRNIKYGDAVWKRFIKPEWKETFESKKYL